MRRKLALLLATSLAGGMIALGGAAPAHACDEVANDPIYNWVCSTVHSAPDIKQTVNHYYNVVWNVADYVYCTASPNC